MIDFCHNQAIFLPEFIIGKYAMTPASACEALPALPTSPEDLLKLLDSIIISYDVYHHKPVFTVAESTALLHTIPGTHCRNLFVRDKKEAMFLVVAANETPVDLKMLQDKLSCGRLSFGSPERLWRHLGVRPGSVCPFAVINDKDKSVQIVLDAHMMRSERVVYHPLVNDMSVGLSPEGLLRFLSETGHGPRIVDLNG